MLMSNRAYEQMLQINMTLTSWIDIYLPIFTYFIQKGDIYLVYADIHWIAKPIKPASRKCYGCYSVLKNSIHTTLCMCRHSCAHILSSTPTVSHGQYMEVQEQIY